MKSTSKLACFFSVFATVFSLPTQADDTDIYLSASASGNAPYVMFTLDYRQDLSGPFCRDKGSAAGRCVNMLNTPETFGFLQALDVMVNGVPSGPSDGDADGDGLRDSAADMSDFEASKIQSLVAVVRALFEDLSGVHVGLMISNEDSGGTILRGYKEFQAGDGNNAKQELIDILLALPMPTTGSRYHESQPKELHYEWFRYINGGAVIYGDQTANNFDGTNTPPPDPTVFSGGNYVSPFTATPSAFECTNFYEIYATSGNETGSDSDLTAEITADMNSASAAKFEDMVSYMSNNDMLTATPGDQTLKSWYIQIGSAATFTDDWAEAAGTDDQYMELSGNAVDLVNIKNVLESVFTEANSTSASFATTTVPVNIFNRAEAMDNIFIAMFEPQSTERWPGNIKKFKLSDPDLDFDFDYVIDQNNNRAFDSDDGLIKYSALSFWTDAGALPTADPDKGEIAGRDGRTVSRGGAGQKIPGFTSDDVGTLNSEGKRQVFVEPASGTTFENFDADTTTATALQSLLGAADVASAQELISWARGQDVDDEDGDTLTNDTRPWLMGDIIHSSPLPISYGTTGGYSTTNPNIRLFFGSNNGFFHIIQNTSTAGTETGSEIFSFIPRELLGNLQALRSNAGSSTFPSSSSAHPYGMDGEPVALVVDADNNIDLDGSDEVYIYTGMRRGGKSYYALDASDPGSNPSLLWKISKTVSGDFDELGYTFSTPRVAKVRFESTPRDVLIFAGGFDLNKDGSAGSIARGPDAEGNAIYIVDARTGALVWKATGVLNSNSNTILYESELTHSIPSSVTTLDSNGNGIVDRLYVGDTGSVLWRVDLPEGTASDHRLNNWSITKLGDFYNPSGSQDRRFFHAPEVVQTKDSTGAYDGILLVTGDRANPTETRDTNFIFYVKDRNITSGSPPTPASVGAGVFDMTSIADTTGCVAAACSLLDYSNGWMIELTGRGEKGLSAPLVAGGKAFLTTYLPNRGGSACAPAEGSGQLYTLNLADGTAAFGPNRQQGIGAGIPSDVKAIGQDTLIIPGSGIVNPYGGASSSSKQKAIEAGGKSRYVLYWTSPGYDSL